MADNQNIKGLYETLKREGYTPPEYSRFVADMQNEDNLKGVYKTLQKEGYTPPEYSQFKIDILGDASSTVASATKKAEQAKQAPTAVGQSGGQASGVISASTAPAAPSNPMPKVAEQQAPSSGVTPSVLETDLVKAVKGGAAAVSAPKKASKSGDKIYTFRRGGQDFEVLKSDIDKAGGMSGWEKSHPGAQLRVYMTSPDGALHHVPTKYVAKRQSEGWSVSTKDYAGWQPSWKEKQSLQNALDKGQNTLDDFATATQQAKQTSVATPQKLETLDKTIQKGLTRTELQAQIAQAEAEVAEFEKKLDKRGRELLAAHDKAEGEKKWWVKAIEAAGDASTSGAGRIKTLEDLPEFINDPEYNALKLGLHKAQESLRLLNNVDDHKHNGGFWRDFWRGTGDGIFDVGAWDFGVSHLKDSVTALNITNKAEKKAPLSTAEKDALNAVLDMTGYTQQYGDISRGYRWGNITGTSLTFMKDFLLTGGGMGALEGVGARASLKLAEKAGMKVSEEVLKRAASRGLVSFIKKEGLKGVGALLQEQALPWTVKALGVTAEDLLLRAPLMTNTIQGAETLSKIIDKRREGNSWSQAAWEVEADQVIENYSEMFGAHLPGATDMLKAFGARNLTAAILNSTRAGAGGVLGKVSRFMQRAGVNGYFGEVSEEYYGQLWRTMLGLESSKDSMGKNLFWDPDFHGDIWGGMALSVGLTGGGSMALGYAAEGVDLLVHKARYYQLKRSVNNIDREIGDMLGKDVWEPMRGIIDMTDNAAMGELATQIIKDRSLEPSQKCAILDYMETNMVLRGHNMREFVEQRKPFDKSRRNYDNAFDEGAAVSSREEYIEAIKALNAATKSLRSILRLKDDVNIGDFLVSVYGTDELWQFPALISSDKDLSEEEREVLLNCINAIRRQTASRAYAETKELSSLLGKADKAVDAFVDNTDPNNPVVRYATINATGEEVFILKEADAQSGHVVIRHADGKTEIVAPQDLTIGDVISKKKFRANWHRQVRDQYWDEIEDEFYQATEDAATADTEGQESPDPEFEIGTELEFPDQNSPMAGATDAVIVEVDDSDSTDPRYTVEFTMPDGQRSVVSLTRSQLAQYGARIPSRENTDEASATGENSLPEQQPSSPAAETETETEAETETPAPASTTENTGIPVDEKGRPLYSQAPVEKTIEDLESKGALDNVEFTVESLRKKQRKAVEKEKNARIDLSDPGDGFEKQAKLRAEREAIDKELAYWEEVWNVVRQRKEEEAHKAEEAERKAKEAAEEEAVQQALAEAVRELQEKEEAEAEENSRREAEQERLRNEGLADISDFREEPPAHGRTRGFRRDGSTRIDRQDSIENKIEGSVVTVKFADNVAPEGKYVVIDASSLQPSHRHSQRNPYHFIDEAQPKDRTDVASRLAAEKMAREMRGEEITIGATAYSGSPTVNTRGEVIQGNNRSEALRLMYENNPESARRYKEYLMEHAEDYGMTREQIDSMENPVLVRMLDVTDDQAIELGQYVAADTESGGIERLKPRNIVQKLGDKLRSFANVLLQSSDDEMSFSGLVEANGIDALKWLNERGVITNTQYQSAFDKRGNLTEEARKDLKEILYESIFLNANPALREMFDQLPVKAQRALLATAFRDLSSSTDDRMLSEIQHSIIAYSYLASYKPFIDARTPEEVQRAVEDWKKQYVFDDLTGDSFLPAERFSNFALALATLYKSQTQKHIQSVFNEMYDLIQGTKEADIFAEEGDNVPRTLVEAIKEVLDIDYHSPKNSKKNDNNGSDSLGGSTEAGPEGGQGSAGDDRGAEPPAGGKGSGNNSGGPTTPGSEGVDDASENNKPTLLDVIKALYQRGKKYASQLYGRSFFDVVKTPDFMKKLGLIGDKFTIRYGVIARHAGKDSSHDISEQNWEGLPDALTHPFAITEIQNKDGKNDGFRIYTTLKNGKGEYIVVGVDVKNAGRDLEVNAISTIFGRRKNAGRTIKERVIYKDTKITPHQESLLDRPNSDQYPTDEELSDRKDSVSSTNDQEKEEDFELTIEDLDKLEGVEGVDPAILASARDYLNGSHDAFEQMAYNAIKDYVRNTRDNNDGSRQDADPSQLAGTSDAQPESGRNSGDDRGLDREDGDQDVAESGESGPNGPRGSGPVSGEGGAQGVEGSQSGKGPSDPGGRKSGNSRGVRKRGGDVRKPGRKGSHTQDAPTDGNGPATTGELTPTDTPTSKTEKADPLKKIVEDTYRGAIDDLKDILKNPAMTKPGRLNDATTLLAGLGVNAIRFLSATARLGWSLVMKGFYKFEKWESMMETHLGSLLRENTDLTDEQIAEFIRSAWEMKMDFRGQRKRVSEWAAELEVEELRKLAAMNINEKRKLQEKAEDVEVVINDLDNIRETLPFLLPPQHEDVLKAEIQFYDESHADREHGYGKGYLFTNGTGTGKTYTGLGIVKRALKQGKKRILIVTVNDTKISDWIKDAGNLGIKASALADTKSKGEGVVVTQYANMRQNLALLEDDFDLIVYDESHKLMENKNGSIGLTAIRHHMIANRDARAVFERRLEVTEFGQRRRELKERMNDLLDLKCITEKPISLRSAEEKEKLKNSSLQNLDDINRAITSLNSEVEAVDREFERRIEELMENDEEVRRAEEISRNTKVVFLSATPFNTPATLDYAEGYIFSYPEARQGQNRRDCRNTFLRDKFGKSHRRNSDGDMVRMQDDRITDPEGVEEEEIAFSDHLQEGLKTMSGRVLDSEFDYSRTFPKFDVPIADDVNRAMSEISNGPLKEYFKETLLDYNYSTAFWEIIKTGFAIQRIREHTALGRRVVVFHRRKSSVEEIYRPFWTGLQKALKSNDQIAKTEAEAFEQKYGALLQWEATLDYKYPQQRLLEAFATPEELEVHSREMAKWRDKAAKAQEAGKKAPKPPKLKSSHIAVFNGDMTKNEKQSAVDNFNNPDSDQDVIVIQVQSGKEGISLHDTDGKHQRVMMSLALPQSPIEFIQAEGRIYRVGNRSDAIFEYPLLGVDRELYDFAMKINGRSQTSENLAMGSRARGLRDSITRGALGSTPMPVQEGQGRGGKMADSRKVQNETDFDHAMTNWKEWRDREANLPYEERSIPDPLGKKLMEWAGAERGETVLVPNAGEGSAARYVPGRAKLVALESDSSKLARLAALLGGGGRKILGEVFSADKTENGDSVPTYSTANKADVVVIKTRKGSVKDGIELKRRSVIDLEKALRHTEDSGRVVAIVPAEDLKGVNGILDSVMGWQKRFGCVTRSVVNLPADIFGEEACVVIIDCNQEPSIAAGNAAKKTVVTTVKAGATAEETLASLRDMSVEPRKVDHIAKAVKRCKPVMARIRENKLLRSFKLSGKTTKECNVSRNSCWFITKSGVYVIPKDEILLSFKNGISFSPSNLSDPQTIEEVAKQWVGCRKLLDMSPEDFKEEYGDKVRKNEIDSFRDLLEMTAELIEAATGKTPTQLTNIAEGKVENQIKDDMTLSQFIDIYRTLDSGDTELDELAERVFAVAGKIEGLQFRMAEPGVFSGHNVMAHYAPGKNAIELNRDAFNSTRFSDTQKAQCILHETIHAVTCWALARYKNSSEEERAEMGEVGEACRDIITIYEKHVNTDEFRSHLQVNSARGDNAFYGLSDVYEMVAELANPAFRAVLKMKNLWQQVINGVKRILGIDATESGEGQTNALDVLDRALNTILDNFDPIAYRFYQAYPSKSVHEAAFIPKTGNMGADVAAFKNMRAIAIAEHGIVMPGLAEMEFPVVEVTPIPIRKPFGKALKEILTPFIKAMPKRDNYIVIDSAGREIELTLNRESIDKFKSSGSFRNDIKGKEYRADIEDYFAVFNNFHEVLRGMREVEIHADYAEKNDAMKRDADSRISEDKLIHRYYGAIQIEGKKPVIARMTVYEYRPAITNLHSNSGAPVIHSQEVIKLELSSGTDNSSNHGSENSDGAKAPGVLAGAKLLQNVEKSYDPGIKILDASKKASEGTLEAGPEDDILCRPVTDQETLDKLNSEPTVKVYRAMQLIDGNLYPPMSAKVNGKLRQPTEPSVWEEAEENPDLADAKGTFTLNKGNGKSIKAAYNPYIHTSRSPINDQFSSAWARPELVTVEVEVPVSELNSGYKAEKAKDTVGEKQWKSGPIGRLLAKLGYPRKVILSRWARVTRIVPVEEVADAYAERLNRYGIEVPFNTVPPSLREALAERGVKIGAPEKGNAGDASRPAFDRWLEDQERLRMGDGKGAYSDEEVSYYNDLVSQMYGKNRYTKKQQAKVAQRERRNMMLRLETLAKRMNLDNVEILSDASGLEGKKAKAKGFYNKRTGKITIILANHATMLDAEQTLLHEAVAHYGLRRLFGERFDTFLANVYDAGSDEVRVRITEMAARNGWDYRTATEEYLASLAESTDFEHNDKESWWSKIKNLFIDMLLLIGFDEFRDRAEVELTDNELRYILWRSYMNLVEPGHGSNFLNNLSDIAMQYNLKVGEYAESGITAEHVAESDLFSDSTEEDVELYRPGDFTPRDKVIARDAYNRICSTGSYQFREAVQDSMLGLKALYKAVLPGTEIQDVADFENAYLFENRMSSMNKTHQEVYFREILSPLLKEIAKIAGSSAEKRRDLTDYMMAKHGLERNTLMRKAAINNSENPDRDFAGLTGLTGEKDWRTAEAKAAKWVQDYETAHNTAPLWAAVNVATKTSLEKLYRCGMLSKEKFEEIRDMYEFYIPLRGWDETTSDEVYGYLTSNNGPLSGSILKKAEGRSSKADDPIATIAMMADSAIMQGHRNLLKQRFLNFVLNHPSDAVSVSRLWLQYNDVNDEWEPIFPNVDSTMSAEQVEAEVEAFEERMEKLKAAEPKKYKRGREAQNIPFKTKKSNLREHQILVKRNGETFILTINGNPRAAQAINGLTNPDINTSGWIGDVLKTGEWLNRQLSAFYTTRNPDFVVSNFFRDAIYSNCMTWVKESPRYAMRYNANFTQLLRPAKLFSMIKKWEKGSLDLNDPMEKLFCDFMINGGETGYTSVKDIEGHKRTIIAELKKKRNVARNIWRWIGLQLDTLGRSVEICARFAAFKTSIEFGRSIARAVYDAKEVSVNFNKKGSGSTMLHANGQTKAGEVGAYIGGIGRAGFVFFNAGVQGTVNALRQAKKHPAKFTAGATAMMTLGYIVPVLASMFGGDGDDGDENAYYNLPEYIRRSNVCIRLGNQWLTIPLPIEFRSLYGLGEMAYGVMSGNETYSGSELGYQIASQLSQILPLDFLEGSGGWQTFIPSAFKPMTEAAANKSWTGLPIYKETPFNENDPEWTKAFKNADTNMVAASKWINEQTGGDDYKKGWLDINPAQVEYVLNGYLGGAFSFPSKMWKGLYETPTGQRDFEWKNMPLANRVIKAGDERTAYRKLQEQYFRYAEEYKETTRLLKKYDEAASKGVLGYAEKINFLENSPEFARWEIFDMYAKDMDAYRKAMKDVPDPETLKLMEDEYYQIMREVVDGCRNAEITLNSKQQTNKKRG